MKRVERALLSVSDKSGIVEFAKGLQLLGIEILSTGGTAQRLIEAGVQVVEVSDHTGSPEILNGRVKTLHPKVHGGILARRSKEEDVVQLTEHDIPTIDLVVVNLYPFEETAHKAGVPHSEVLEQIDIGGPTLLRAAAKNHRDVLAVTDPADYPEVLAAVQKAHGGVGNEMSLRYARKAFDRVADYDAAISQYFAQQTEAPQVDHHYIARTERIRSLRYGENPHQEAGWYQIQGQPVLIGDSLQGKELSYNNILDCDAAIRTIQNIDLAAHVVAVVKHGNPCGFGLATNLKHAFERAKAGDPVSAFGGIVACNTEVDADTATAICETFFEVVCAPAFSAGAREVFAKKASLRLVPFDPTHRDRLNIRSACGGVLVQDVDRIGPPPEEWKVVSARNPSKDEMRALQLAWHVATHVHSNAIVFASNHAVLGVGAGQMSRIDSTRVAAHKMQQCDLEGVHIRVAASDAFFPFRDGLDQIAAAGITAVVQPGGSKRDEEVIAAANEHDMALLMTGMRHFKH